MTIKEDKLKIETGDKDEDIYDEAGREEMVESDEIEPWEEGFMEGETSQGKQGKCRVCGKALYRKNTVELRVNDELVWFCSEEHAEQFKQQHPESFE